MDNASIFKKFQNSTTININGEMTSPTNAKISIFDRGFLYGDSIYEVTYTEDGTIIFLDEHIDRLFNSANLLNMTIDLTRDEIKQQFIKTLKASELERAYIRLIITRGESALDLDPNISFQNNYVVIVKPRPEYPAENYTRGLHLAISSVIRNSRESINPNAKSGNYLNNVLALNEAKKLGADDALMVNKDGYITEGTTFNIWIVKDQIVKTPPETSGLLKGITREKVITICQTNDIPLLVADLTPEDILQADEVFITSSTKGLMPIYQINQKIYPLLRPMVKKLSDHYQHIISEQKQNKKYQYL